MFHLSKLFSFPNDTCVTDSHCLPPARLLMCVVHTLCTLLHYCVFCCVVMSEFHTVTLCSRCIRPRDSRVTRTKKRKDNTARLNLLMDRSWCVPLVPFFSFALPTPVYSVNSNLPQLCRVTTNKLPLSSNSPVG